MHHTWYNNRLLAYETDNNLLVSNVVAYHNKEQWEDACSCKNTAEQLVKKENNTKISVSTVW